MKIDDIKRQIDDCRFNNPYARNETRTLREQGEAINENGSHAIY